MQKSRILKIAKKKGIEALNDEDTKLFAGWGDCKRQRHNWRKHPVTEKASSSPENDSKKKDSKKKESKDAKDAKKQDSKDAKKKGIEALNDEDTKVFVPGVTVKDNKQQDQTPVAENASSSPEKDSRTKDSKKKDSKDAKDAKKQDSKDAKKKGIEALNDEDVNSSSKDVKQKDDKVSKKNSASILNEEDAPSPTKETSKAEEQGAKVEKSLSRKWSFRKQKSKKEKDKTSPVESNDDTSIDTAGVDIESPPLAKKQKAWGSPRKGSKDHEASSETTVERKSFKKTKSPKLFSRKTKDKKSEESIEDAKEDEEEENSTRNKKKDKGVEVTPEDVVDLIVTESLPSYSECGTGKAPIAEAEEAAVTASSENLREKKSSSKQELRASRSEIPADPHSTKLEEKYKFRAADVKAEKGQMSRSKSMEVQEKKIRVHVKDTNGKQSTKVRSTSMKNLKGSREKLPAGKSPPAEGNRRDKVATVMMPRQTDRGSGKITIVINDKKPPEKSSQKVTVKPVEANNKTPIVVTPRPDKPPRFEPLTQKNRPTTTGKPPQPSKAQVYMTTSPEARPVNTPVKTTTSQPIASASMTTTRHVNATYVAPVAATAMRTSPVSVTNRTTAAASKPMIVVTPAYEAETFAPAKPEKALVHQPERAKVRQTAYVTVSRETVTVDTPPPQPIYLPPQGPSSGKRTITKYTTTNTVSNGPTKVEVQNRNDRTYSEEDRSVEPVQDRFQVVKMKHPAGQEHKLLQVTMQTVCQKARQLQTLMSNTHAIEASLGTHHHLQLLAITDKETEMNVVIGRIAAKLKSEVDSKIGVSLRRVADHIAECNLQLTTFHSIIESGNQLLEQGSMDDVIRKERELTGHLKVLDKHLRALQNEPQEVDMEEGKVVFIPGTTDNLELRAMFGDLAINDEDEGPERTERQKQRGPPPQLMWSDNPWIPYFRRNENRAKTGNELMNARIREEDCIKAVMQVLNMVCPKNFTGFVSELLGCGIDSEMKMKRLCEVIVSLAAGYHRLAETLALVCRCISSISVPNDSHQETRQAPRSTALNFVDRFCMRRYQISSGAFLATGMTPAISRAGSYSMIAKGDSLGGNFRGSRSSIGHDKATNMYEQPGKYGTWRAGAGSSLQLPAHGSAPTTLDRNFLPNFDVEVLGNLGEVDRRYGNLSILKFICEMFKLRLNTENMVHEWLQRLTRVDDDEAIEAICFILFQIGRSLDHKRAQHITNKVFVQLTYTINRTTTPGRLRAMIRDVLHLRECEWIPVKNYNYWQYLLV